MEQILVGQKKYIIVSANLNQQIMLHTLLALHSTTFHPQMREIGWGVAFLLGGDLRCLSTLYLHGRWHHVYTLYKSIDNPFTMLSFWDKLGMRKNLIVNSKCGNAIVRHPNLKIKLRIWQPIKSKGLVSPKNLSLMQIQSFAIVFASTANPPRNTKYSQGFVHKAILYANEFATCTNLVSSAVLPLTLFT